MSDENAAAQSPDPAPASPSPCSRWRDLWFGPVFIKEMIELSHRPQLYIVRVIVGTVLLLFLGYLWSSFSGSFDAFGDDAGIKAMATLSAQAVHTIGVVGAFLMFLLPPFLLMDVITRERDRRTLELLFLTDLSDSEIALGKMASRLVVALLSLVVSVPIIILCQFFGGVSLIEILIYFVIALVALLYSVPISLWCAVQRAHPAEIFTVWLSLVISTGLVYMAICVGASMVLFQIVAFLTSGFGNSRASIAIAFLAFGGIGVLWIAVIVTHGLLFLRSSIHEIGQMRIHEEKRLPPRVQDEEEFQTSAFPRPSRAWRDWAPALFTSVVIVIYGLLYTSLLANTDRQRPEAGFVLVFVWMASWLLAARLSVSHPFLRLRPGVWDDLLTTPLTSREMVHWLAAAGAAGATAHLLVPVAIGVALAPLGPVTMARHVAAGLPFALWTILFAWSAGIVARPMAPRFGLLCACIALIIFGPVIVPIEWTFWAHDWATPIFAIPLAIYFRYRVTQDPRLATLTLFGVFQWLGWMSIAIVAANLAGATVQPITSLSPLSAQFEINRSTRWFWTPADWTILAGSVAATADWYFWLVRNFDRLVGRTENKGPQLHG